MNNLNQSIIKTLSHLITLAEDGKKGYIYAIKNIREMRKQAALLDLVIERKNFVNDLKSLVSRLSDSQAKSISVYTFLNREWRDLKILLTTWNNYNIIKNCICRDEATLKYYEAALYLPYITGDILLLLKEQHACMEKALNSIRRFTKDYIAESTISKVSNNYIIKT